VRPPIRSRRAAVLSVALLGVMATGAVAATQPWHAGPGHDGTAVTPVGFRVTPAGQQIDLGDLPLNAVASPDGRWLVVPNAGQGKQSLQVVDTRSGKVAQTIDYPSPQALFTGLVFSRDGKTLYASASGNNKIRTYSVAGDGKLTEGNAIQLPTKSETGKKLNPFPAGLALTPDGGRLLIADRLADAVTSVDLKSGAQQTVGVGHNPFAVVASPDGNRAWVTEQGSNTVTVLDISGGHLAPTGGITVGTHPNQAVLDRAGKSLYVANADSDEVSVVDTASGKVQRTVSLAPYEKAPVGTNPDGLSLSPDERTLYVANSGNNDIAVVDVASGKVKGLVPTAWYPTAAVPVGDKLFVTNAKGLGAGPNNGPGHPNPESSKPTSPDQYSGSMIVGTLSVIPKPDDSDQLRRWTEQVRRNNGFDEHGEVHDSAQSEIMPTRVGQASPIKHVIYVVKENRTYDQVFGSPGKGNGDSKLNLFGDESAPNSRQLQKDFVTFDNFYADAEVSAQGWNWAVAANSNPYSEQGWPANYSPRGHSYPSESGDPAIAPNRDPANAYIWDRLKGAGVSFRNYGFYVSPKDGGFSAADPVLDANTDHNFRGFDLNCADSAGTFTPGANCGTPRIDEWLKEFGDYEAKGNLPAAQFIRLPNDHTAGTKVGAPTPKAFVADNDLALGRLVDAVSHSEDWASTAIFVTEDDAQNGPDDVDAHRTPAQVISPYTRTGRVDSTFYNTSSMLRTIELLLGVGPMTQFDAYSTPMARAFTTHPNGAAYNAIKPTTPPDQRNGANAPMSAQSAGQDLQSEDKIDEQTFNQAIWQSVHGADSQMPAPVHMVPTVGGPAAESGVPEGDADGDGH
jgi:YVTN family beta-propeller protein